MKKHNPQTPIMIREALNVEPRVYARYGASRNLNRLSNHRKLITHIHRVWQREDGSAKGYELVFGLTGYSHD